MSGTFDPYHLWLGIPPKYQPPDHYRLLGVEQFEDNAEVISDAAERQIAHVRRKALSQHSTLSQKILNELAAAKSCLINAQKKKAYDNALRSQLQASRSTADSTTEATPSPGKQILVACACGQAFRAEAYLAGATVPCPACGNPLLIADSGPDVTSQNSSPWSTGFPAAHDSFGAFPGEPVSYNFPQVNDGQSIQGVLKSLRDSTGIGSHTILQFLRISAILAVGIALCVPLVFALYWASKFDWKSLLPDNSTVASPTTNPTSLPPTNPTPSPPSNSPINAPANPQPNPQSNSQPNPGMTIQETAKRSVSRTHPEGFPLHIHMMGEMRIPMREALRFELEPGYPPGVALNETGMLTWTPDESQGPATHVFVVNAIGRDSGRNLQQTTFQINVRDMPPRNIPPRPQFNPGPPPKSIRF